MHHSRRNPRPSRTPCIVAFLATAYCLLPTAAFTQDLFVTSDRTIAGGNPISGDFSSIVVGTDGNFNPFPGVTADYTGEPSPTT